jgi:glycosyltransferase involved in cell wall biosynthesis
MESSQRLIRNRPRAFTGQRIAVAGLFRTRCGLRRGAELMMRDFRSKGVEVFPVDLSVGLGAPINTDYPDLLQPGDLAQLSPTDLVIHMNPPAFTNALDLFPSDVLEKTSIVGYWAWELSVVSDDWRHCAECCDAIWVPSAFVADAIYWEIPRFAGELRVVPHAVDQDPMPRWDMAAKLKLRERLGIAADQFVVGYSFAFDSNYSRKNCPAVIDAFRLAFPESDCAATLVIRCHDADKHAHLFAHLQSYAGDDDRIRIYDVSKTPLSVVEFYAALDVYLALFRSEGYGLNLAEAAQAGVKVVATGWGLASDIAARPDVYPVDYRLVVPIDAQHFYEQFKGAVWAEPDLSHAAQILKSLRDRQG